METGPTGMEIDPSWQRGGWVVNYSWFGELWQMILLLFYFGVLLYYIYSKSLLLKSSGKRNVHLPCSMCWTQGQVENTRSCRSTVGRRELFTNLFVSVSHLSLGLSILNFAVLAALKSDLNLKTLLVVQLYLVEEKKSVRFRIPLKRFIIKRKRGESVEGKDRKVRVL